MTNSARLSVARIAVGAFGALSLMGGWVIVGGRGFHHAPGKYSSQTILVERLPATLMASLQMLAAALAFTWILKRHLSSIPSVCLAFGVVFVPPLSYALIP